MKRDRSSRTAAWVAACRGLAPLLPEEGRLVDDPFGARFGEVEWLRRVGERLPRAAIRALALVPGGVRSLLYMQVRTRVLDDELRAFVRAGGRQVVLLGAGFDCRAARFAGELEESIVYEIDHPATQARKRAVVGELARVRYLAWDFEARSTAELPDALAAAGHDRARPSLTLWEGVTPYLTEPAIEATTRAIASYSAAGSRLVFTYFDRSLLARPTLEMRVLKRAVARIGEPFRFGWDPAALPAWLEARGFRLQGDRTMGEWGRALLPPRFAAALNAESRRVATAAVD